MTENVSIDFEGLNITDEVLVQLNSLGIFRPGQLLVLLALGGIVLSLGTIFIGGMLGLYCLIGISACMSLMFPTIYGIALKDLGDDASLGSAGLVMAIVGGALMPPLQATMIDNESIIGADSIGSDIIFSSFVLLSSVFMATVLTRFITLKVMNILSIGIENYD